MPRREKMISKRSRMTAKFQDKALSFPTKYSRIYERVGLPGGILFRIHQLFYMFFSQNLPGFPCGKSVPCVRISQGANLQMRFPSRSSPHPCRPLTTFQMIQHIMSTHQASLSNSEPAPSPHFKCFEQTKLYQRLFVPTSESGKH